MQTFQNIFLTPEQRITENELFKFRLRGETYFQHIINKDLNHLKAFKANAENLYENILLLKIVVYLCEHIFIFKLDYCLHSVVFFTSCSASIYYFVHKIVFKIILAMNFSTS